MLDAILGLIEDQLEDRPEDTASDLLLITEQIHRLTGMLARLAAVGAAQADRAQQPALITLPVMRAIINARRLRMRYLGADIADAGWTLILVLYAARLNQQRLSATQLGEAASLPHSTSLRWIHKLHDKGLLTWKNDPDDERIALIGLSEAGAERLESYLKTAFRLSAVIP